MDVIFTSLGIQLLGHMVSVCLAVFLKALPIYFLDGLFHFTVLPAVKERPASSTSWPVSGIVSIFILSPLIDV